MPRALKQSNALSWNDRQLACLNDKPDPRLVLAKKPPFNWSPSNCKYSLIPCFTSPLWADSSEAIRFVRIKNREMEPFFSNQSQRVSLRFFCFGLKTSRESEKKVWKHIVIGKVCQNNSYSFCYMKNMLNFHIISWINVFCYQHKGETCECFAVCYWKKILKNLARFF